MQLVKRTTLFLALGLLLPTILQAQPASYNHPELIWEVYDSEHFQVMFHQGSERTAREILRIAEDIYEPTTELYNYEPEGKIRFIVKDHDDYSNGGAYYYDNKILIWAKPMDFDLRGTHNWLRNVVTHEFTHMMQLGASRKLPRWLPAFYFQVIDYEEEKRPDVLYGYPNILSSYPLPMTIIPPWYAEGCAQSQAPGMGYDHWDSHRDMILRMRTLENNLLTYTEMGYYGKTSYNAEGVYDHGYALVQYITHKYGWDKLGAISHDMQNAFAFTFDYALKRNLGINGGELYDDWVQSMQQTYQERTATIQDNLVTGELIEAEGFANLNPAWSPDGKKLAFTSNKGGDYFANSQLYVYDLESEQQEAIQSGIGSPLSWNSDGRFIFYDKQFGPGPKGSHWDDLAVWDTEEEKEIRLTRHLRASHVDVSADGRQVCFTVNADGTQNLWIADLKENWWEIKDNVRIENERALTHFNNGDQVYKPRWSPDGSSIAFSWNRHRDRDLRIMEVVSGEMITLAQTTTDERDPVWVDNESLYFSSDRTGIFNLYRYDLNSGNTTPITNMLGGAFMPSVSADGQIAYIDFQSTGFKLAKLETVTEVDPVTMSYVPDYEETLPGIDYAQDLAPDLSSHAYKPIFDHTFIFPRLAFNFGTFMPGFYFYFQDILEQMSAFGGFAINEKKDYDLFVLLDYNKLYPTIFLEGYNLVRHTSQSFEDPFVIVGEEGTGPEAVPIFDQYSIDYDFNLIEVDGGIKLKLSDETNLRVAGILSRYRTTLNLDNGLAFGYTYFKGISAEAKLTADYRGWGRNQDISPSLGHFAQLTFAREYNDFIDGFEINADKGTLEEVYTRYTYNRFGILADKYLKSPLHSSHGITLTADASFLSQDDVDDFFHTYAGGFDGMRGYSFYSLGGTRKAILRGTYNLPLWRDIAAGIGPFDLDKIYLSVYGDVG
ncbi:hypothetical protein KKA00_04735, partial [bacterium]|nr:hypothetical protein [bacterium]